MQKKASIISVKQNNRGEITDVVLDNGNVYSINEAKMMAKDNLLDGFRVETDTNGKEYIESTKNTTNELNNLPFH